MRPATISLPTQSKADDTARFALPTSKMTQNGAPLDLASIPQEQIEEYKDAFDMFDENSDGRISFDELKAMMGSLGQTCDDEEARKIMDSADKDGNGYIDFEEFVKVMQKNQQSVEDTLREAFKTLDKDGNGNISAEELKKVLKSLGDQTVSDCDVEEMIREIDLDGDGQVDYEEFVKMMMAKN